MNKQVQMEAIQAQASGAGGDQVGHVAGEALAAGEAQAAGEALAAGEAQAGGEALAARGALIADELLVEEISIDGMCGVY